MDDLLEGRNLETCAEGRGNKDGWIGFQNEFWDIRYCFTVMIFSLFNRVGYGFNWV
jgi:hypothetical protein